MVRRLTVAGLVVVMFGCEQEPQGLPFDAQMATTRSVSSEGGALSSPAGAGLIFPSGAVTAPLTVTLTQTTAPGSIEGTVASPAFSIEPANALLDKPAELELRLSPQIPAASAWLASLVGVSGGVVTENPGGRVDLATGILTTPIGRLGTFLAVVPPSSAVFPVQSSGAALSLAGSIDPAFLGVTADSVKVDCGAPGHRCTGVSASASNNLMNLVESAALLYPVMTGALKIGTLSVDGSLTARGTLRVLFESGQTAESVEIHALLQPTAQTVVTQSASELRLTNMRHRISGAASGSETETEEIATLIIPMTGSTGRVTVRRTFNIRVQGGVTEPATVSFTFPVQVFE